MSACGSSAPDAPTPTPVPTAEPGRGPLIEGTAELAGSVEGRAEIRILYPLGEEARSSCAALARGDRRTHSYTIPLPSTIGDTSLLWRSAIRDYRGPGEFDEADLAVFSVEVRTADQAVTYEKRNETTVSVTVNDDNSGSITFDDLREPEGGRISGSARWTCR